MLRHPSHWMLAETAEADSDEYPGFSVFGAQCLDRATVEALLRLCAPVTLAEGARFIMDWHMQRYF